MRNNKIAKRFLKQREYLILIAGLILVIAGIIHAIYARKEYKKNGVEKIVPIIVKHPEITKKILPEKVEIQPKKDLFDKERPEHFISPKDFVPEGAEVVDF